MSWHARLSFPVFLGCLALAAGYAPAVLAQTELSGGATEVDVPQGNTQPALTFTNKTGVPICDLVISRAVGAFDLQGALVDDPQHGNEDWDVDDNANDVLDGGESAAAPGAGGEGGGGAALAHADNNLPAAAGKIRVQETQADADNEMRCVGNNRTFQVTLTFSAAPMAGDKVRVQPTNVRDRNLFAFADGILGGDETWVVDAAATINTTFSGFGAAPALIDSVAVTVEGRATLTELRSEPPGNVDLSAGTITFDPPIFAGQGLLVEGTLSGAATAIVSVTGSLGPVAAIPAASPAGLLAIALLILAAGAAILRRRPGAAGQTP